MRRSLLLGVLLLVSGPAGADLDIPFNTADRNGDSFVDANELAAVNLFGRHDINGDGFISDDELGSAERLAEWDADDSGDLSPAEFYRGVMAYADINTDRLLSSLEFPRALEEWTMVARMEGAPAD